MLTFDVAEIGSSQCHATVASLIHSHPPSLAPPLRPDLAREAYQTYGSVRRPNDEHKKLGAPKKLSDADAEALFQELIRNGWRDQSKMVLWLREERGLSVSQATISRFLKARNWTRKTLLPYSVDDVPGSGALPNPVASRETGTTGQAGGPSGNGSMTGQAEVQSENGGMAAETTVLSGNSSMAGQAAVASGSGSMPGRVAVPSANGSSLSYARTAPDNEAQLNHPPLYRNAGFITNRSLGGLQNLQWS
jgi:hypothetical protein